MIKSLFAGSLALSLIAAVTWLIQNPSLFQSAALIVGLISFAASGVLSGAFVSGDRLRANYADDGAKDRWERRAWSGKLFMFGLPCLLAALVSYRYF